MTELEIPETGAVFTFGKSRFADNRPSHFFIKNDPVVGVACGDEHTAVICKNGRVFAFGSNDWGQLGLGHNKTAIKPSCVKALKPEVAKLVACGRAHTVVITESKKVFAFGSNQDGQLGLGNLEMTNFPTRVTCNDWQNENEFVKVAAGSQHTAVLLGNGKVYMWGSNAEGQLGMENSLHKSIKTPTLLDFPDKIVDISCGYYHTIMLTENGDVYVFGENENGKLGFTPNGSSYIWKPTKLNIDQPIASIACGGNHNFLLTQNKTAITFGSNMYGELGVNKEITNITEPMEITYETIQEPIQKISCGENHTAILTESAKVYTCGDVRHGKLCHEEISMTNSVYVPKLIPKFDNYVITDVTCGGCHTIICARKIEPTGATPTEKSVLPPLQKVLLHQINTDSKSSTNSDSSNEAQKQQQETTNTNASRPDSKIEMTKIDEENMKNMTATLSTSVEEDIMKQLPKSLSENIEKQMSELQRENGEAENENSLEKIVSPKSIAEEAMEKCEKMAEKSVESLAKTADDLQIVDLEAPAENGSLPKGSSNEKKEDSMENLIKEIEGNGMEDDKSVSATDTVSVKSQNGEAMENEEKSPAKSQDEDEIVMKKGEMIDEIITTKANEGEGNEDDEHGGQRRFSKMFNTFRRKKIANAGRTVNIMRKLQADMQGSSQEGSKACVIL